MNTISTFKKLIVLLGALGFVNLATVAYAESAPVFDADSMQQYDTISDQQDLPPPPLPDQDGTFIPMQREQQSMAARDMNMPRGSFSLEQRVRRMEQQFKNMQSSEPNAQIDSLQSQVQSLRSQVEQLAHDLQQLQNQQKNLLTELDKRIAQQINSKPTAVASTKPAATNEDADVLAKLTRKPPSIKDKTAEGTAAATNDQPNVQEEQQIYQSAYNLIKAKKFAEAVTTLQTMLQKYPTGQFASNAHYWLGELYGVMGKNDLALNEFGIVVRTYPDSPRVSDAQFKVGLIYAAQFKWTDAKAAFKKVINHYPASASARLASEQLKQIRQAGH